MSPSSIPFWGMLVAVILGVIHALDRYEIYRWEKPDTGLYCTPHITEGSRKLGKELATEPPGSVERFDLVCFTVPRSADATARVVGLPGERVELNNGQLTVNGQPIENPYANYRGSGGDWLPEILVPRECVLVLNDERGKRGSMPSDSRELGPIPLGSVTYRFSASAPVKGR